MLSSTRIGVTAPARRLPSAGVSFADLAAFTFSNPKPDIDKTEGKATTTATFTAPGEYVLRLQANDVSGEGGGGFQCCWTNAHVKVIVKPGAVSR